jgi:thiamine-monophosphate kinase
MASEFSIIEEYFSRPTPSATLGVGDDAALVSVTPGMELAISTDMLVSGTHFFPDTDPQKLGWKTLAVNISDLAAMGAQPRWATLSLALEQADPHWLSAFSQGFFRCAAQYGVELIGGDTTRGPLNLSVSILGEVPRQQALRRDAAKVGDDIWVSGTLGAAALGLAAVQKQVALSEIDHSHCLRALETPQPRVKLGLALRDVAHAAIDISDGLLADLGHILERSNIGATLHFDQIPCHPALSPFLEQPWARQCLLAGGDDYELCFTAPGHQRERMTHMAEELHVALHRIGHITNNTGLTLLDTHGNAMPTGKAGYDHFA